jgi:hypothetical protein
MRYREVLKHFNSVSWELWHDTREKEPMKMNCYKSLESSDYYYDRQSSRTYPFTNKRHDEPQQTYGDAQYHCRETRMRYMQIWNELEACQEEMESSEINYFKTLQAFGLYQKGKWSGRRNDEACKRLDYVVMRLENITMNIGMKWIITKQGETLLKMIIMMLFNLWLLARWIYLLKKRCRVVTDHIDLLYPILRKCNLLAASMMTSEILFVN